MGAGFAPVFGVPESTPASRPFSLTIRLNTSPTERTPWPGFQSYLPDITRASPVNLSESVPASFPKAACNSCRLRLRQRHHQSDRKRAHSVLSQNLLHVEFLLITKRFMLLFTANAGLNAVVRGQWPAKNQNAALLQR